MRFQQCSERSHSIYLSKFGQLPLHSSATAIIIRLTNKDSLHAVAQTCFMKQQSRKKVGTNRVFSKTSVVESCLIRSNGNALPKTFRKNSWSENSLEKFRSKVPFQYCRLQLMRLSLFWLSFLLINMTEFTFCFITEAQQEGEEVKI